MKATFKQVNDAHALLKAITLIHSQEKIQNIYGEGLKILYVALNEIEVEKESVQEVYEKTQTKTAVDSLVHKLRTKNINLYCEKDVIDKSKNIEKGQIIDAFEEGFTEGCRYTTGFEQTQWCDADDYYERTFKLK